MPIPVDVRRPTRLGAPFVRTWSFVRKELAELLRQPRMLGLLVIGPFLLLVLFGIGYSQSDLVLRATFVGPEGSVYEEVLSTYADDLGEFIEPHAFVPTEAEGRAHLAAGDVDVVVVFPDDPVETVLGGEQAIIRVIHDEIDPLQQTAIWVASKIAVQEVNATVLSTIAGDAQLSLPPGSEVVASLDAVADELDAAAADPERTDAALARADRELADLSAMFDGSLVILDRLDAAGDDVDVDDLRGARTAVSELRTGLPSDGDDTAALAADLRAFAETYRDVVALDPAVLVRPFDSSTESVLTGRIEPSDYFAPASLALLLQHMGVTFAALSLVRDRSTGLFELMRVSPLSPAEIVIGKCTAYLVLGGLVAAVLLTAAVLGLGVPMVGSVAWLAAVVVGVVVASLALGMTLSMLSRTESQAVQFAMLSLLAGLFFSGFVLSIDDLIPPVRVISFLLPVTYGIRAFQDVMFRGAVPSLFDIGGFVGLSVLYGAAAVTAVRSKLRIT